MGFVTIVGYVCGCYSEAIEIASDAIWHLLGCVWKSFVESKKFVASTVSPFER